MNSVTADSTTRLEEPAKHSGHNSNGTYYQSLTAEEIQVNIDIAGMVETMWGAAKGRLGNCAATAEPFAKSQFANIAQTVASIAEGVASGQINNDQAKYLLSIQEHATKSAMLAVEGLGIIAVEAALNAALGAVTGLVNGVVGFALI